MLERVDPAVSRPDARRQSAGGRWPRALRRRLRPTHPALEIRPRRGVRRASCRSSTTPSGSATDTDRSDAGACRMAVGRPHAASRAPLWSDSAWRSSRSRSPACSISRPVAAGCQRRIPPPSSDSQCNRSARLAAGGRALPRSVGRRDPCPRSPDDRAADLLVAQSLIPPPVRRLRNRHAGGRDYRRRIVLACWRDGGRSTISTACTPRRSSRSWPCQSPGRTASSSCCPSRWPRPVATGNVAGCAETAHGRHLAERWGVPLALALIQASANAGVEFAAPDGCTPCSFFCRCSLPRRCWSTCARPRRRSLRSAGLARTPG